MNTHPRHFHEDQLGLVDKQIEITKQQIEFEQTVFGHAYKTSESPRVRYLLDDLDVLNKQRAVVKFLLQNS